MIRPLNDRQLETLRDLRYVNCGSRYPKVWATPLDLGAQNGSHHSATLASLAMRGLVQFKQRGAAEPSAGQNGARNPRGFRGSLCYRITPAGIAALPERKTK